MPDPSYAINHVANLNYFDIQEKARQANVAKMKNYIDPRVGAVSFSGVDYEAIVYLPLSRKQLQQKIQILTKQRTELSDKVEESRGVWDLYNTSILDELTDADYAFEQYDYYLGIGNQVQADFWYDEYTGAKTRERELLKNRDNAGGGLANRNYLLRELEAVSKELEELRAISIKSERFTRPVKLFDVQTISIQSHREKFPARTLGRINARSYVRGQRTIAGSLIFTLFNKHALWDLVQAGSGFYSSGVGILGTDSGYKELSTMLVDQLPPFDVTLIAANELGDISYATIYGMEIVNDGRTFSIQDMITENVMQFVCRDFDDLRPLGSRRNSLLMGLTGGQEKTATDIVKQRRTEQQRRKIRLNPFV